jgi:hypothetical protein
MNGHSSASNLPQMMANDHGNRWRTTVTRMNRMITSGACATLLLWTGCNSPTTNGDWSLGEPIVVTGLSAPECCLFDSDSGAVFVSNVVAAEGDNPYWSDDGAGHLSLLESEGDLRGAKWLESTPGQVLNAPKGMCICGGRLWAADNSRIISVSLEDGADFRVTAPPGAMMLNDMASDGTHVYVSDTGAGKILRIGMDGEVETVASLEAVNGITFFGEAMFAVSWGLHEIFEIDLSGVEEPRPFGLAEHFTNLDGIEILDDGTFLVTDFEGGTICTVSSDRTTVKVLARMTTPADLGLNREDLTIYVPSLKTDTVHIYALR